MSRLEERYDRMAALRIHPDDFPDDAGDRIMEVFLLEGFIAGIAQRVLDGDGGPRGDEIEPLRKLYLDGREWIWHGNRFDFSAFPDVVDYIRAIELVRMEILRHCA